MKKVIYILFSINRKKITLNQVAFPKKKKNKKNTLKYTNIHITKSNNLDRF